MRPKTRRSGSAAEAAARRAVIATALEMSRSGLSPGRSGNVSQRFGDGMLITPSGMSYDVLKPADIVFVLGDGSAADNQRKPSSEWRFHWSAYQARPDGHAIVHTHSLHATTIACTGKAIPAFHYMVAIAGGKDIPCVPYATFGTEELADLVADGLSQRDACLMANHGQITIASDLDRALELAQEIEIIAEQYAKLLAVTSKPPLLPDDEMADVLVRFKGYGQKAQGSKPNI
ncbi:MAG: class II aldolase/adducin family protein [Hyphomicrobiaceae bacterium]